LEAEEELKGMEFRMRKGKRLSSCERYRDREEKVERRTVRDIRENFKLKIQHTTESCILEDRAG
jgi:hypothetical protein